MPNPSIRHFTQLLPLTAPAPSPAVARPTADPYRLAISVTHADGRLTRWGPREVSSQAVPTGLTFGTSIPGGFKDMSCSLLRRLDIDYPDEALFDNVRVYGPGNQTAWEGRIAQFPRQHADQFSVTPGAVGWSAHLEDDPSFREIYVDRDLSNWGAPSLTRKVNIITSGYSYHDHALIPDDITASPVIGMEFQGPWNTTGLPLMEATYRSHGIPIGYLYYRWTKGGNVTAADPNWTWSILLATNDTITTYDNSGELRGAGPGAGTFSATATNRFVAMLQFGYNTAAGGDSRTYGLYWPDIAVYGNQPISRRGGEPGGMYASDVIADIVSRAAPLLTYSTGADGSISPTTFIIPHLVFSDPTKASDAISLINGYHLYEWGVYDGREFFWRPPDPDRLTWEARLSDGAQVSLEGDDANNIFNGVFVTYTDPTGQRKTVGPPGSIADATDASLVDTDPQNPINAHGIPRRWGLLDVSQTTTQAGAVQLGAVWLAEHRLPTRRGQLTLTGLVDHPTQGKRPVWQVRAGDYIRIADRPGDPVRRIIETSYDHDPRRLTASLDNTVFKIEALMERMGISLVGVI